MTTDTLQVTSASALQEQQVHWSYILQPLEFDFDIYSILTKIEKARNVNKSEQSSIWMVGFKQLNRNSKNLAFMAEWQEESACWNKAIRSSMFRLLAAI